MTNYRELFIAWYFNEFSQSTLMQDMHDTTEDSPWHRERSVAIHTNMVVAQFIATINPDRIWDRDDICRALVCVFHDVGKPSSKVLRHSEERGDYYRFSGHEQVSARMWEHYAATNWKELVETFKLEPRHIYKVGWMIEYHKPWDIKKPAKLKLLAKTISMLSWVEQFGDVLMSDTKGRISDTSKHNILKGQDWIDDLVSTNLILEPEDINDHAPVMHVLIGASGSGKSTWLKNKLVDYSANLFSLDELRLRWYNSDEYSKAYALAVDDNTFMSKANAEFMRLIKLSENLIIDNTNLSNKRRRFYITEAKKRGYELVAVLFPVDTDTLITRQSTRSDKSVPSDVVVQQYMRIQTPCYGEFDDVIVCGDNLLS